MRGEGCAHQTRDRHHMKTNRKKSTVLSIDPKATVRLMEITIDGYRSCRSSTFKPHHELSALIGINGAGKTNLLNAVRLLAIRPNRGRGLHPDARAANETVITSWFDVGGTRVGLRLIIKLTESNRNTDEVIAVAETWNLFSITGSTAWSALPPLALMMNGEHDRLRLERVERDMFLYASKMQRVAIPRSGAQPSRLVIETLLGNEAVRTAISLVTEFRRGIAYYSASQFTDPTRCPSSFEIDEESRISDTYGVSIVHQKFIYDLYRLKTANPELYSEYERFVSRPHLGMISRITWKAIELSSNTADVKSGGTIKKIRKRKTLVIPKIQIGSSYITFNQLSEGTFKTLALVFYVMTDSSRCLLVEEPEVCVYHGLLSRIIDTIKAYSKSKQVIFSTHSDLLLDNLNPENTFVVEMLRGGTKVTALETWVGVRGRTALHTYLNESGTLGEYWRSGGLS
jgi:energy-coupling factor transporter ATP-binding protein EcfA2